MVATSIIIIVLYFITLIILTLRTPKSTKETSFEDFYTGSKSMGAIVVGLVMLVTYYSGTTWTGWTGFTAEMGIFGAYMLPYAVFAGIAMYMLSGKIWPLGKRFNLGTMADIFELRYRSIGLKMLIGFLGATLNITWITMELVTIGYIINIATGGAVSLEIGALIGVIFMTAYTLWGGVRSVSSVNTFQSSLMVAGAIGVVMYAVYSTYGSVTNMFEVVLSIRPETFIIDGAHNMRQWFSFVLLCAMGVLCYPSLYMKFYLGKSTNEVKKSSIFNVAGALWSILILFGGFAIIGYEAVTQVSLGTNAEEGFLLIVKNSGNAFVYGLALVFILAGTMGTVDGTLLAISGIFSSDLIQGYKRIQRKSGLIGEENYSLNEASDNMVKRTRIIIVIVSVLGYFVTLMDLPLLVMIAMINYQGIALFFVPLIGALMWKKGTKIAAYVSVIAGFIVTFGLMVLKADLSGYLPGVIGVLIGAVLYFVVSLATYKEELPEAKYYEVIKSTITNTEKEIDSLNKGLV